MSISRLFAAGLVFMAFAMYGAVNGSRHNARVTLLKGLYYDVAEMRTRLKLLHEPLDVITENMATSGKCKELWSEVSIYMKKGKSFGEAFGESDRRAFGNEEIEIMYELSAQLGKNNVAEEEKRLEFAAIRLNELYKKLKEDTEKGVKLTNSLSVLGGLAAALLML